MRIIVFPFRNTGPVKWLMILLFLTILGMGIPIHPVKSNPTVPTIRKCCAPDQVIDAFRMKCRDSGVNKWIPRYSTIEDGWIDDPGFQPIVVKQIPHCTEGVHVLPLKELEKHPLITPADFRLLQNGKIIGKHANGDWISIPQDSCIDGIMNLGQEDSPASFSGHATDQAIITCPAHFALD